MQKETFSGKVAQFALDAVSSSLALLDERGEILSTNQPWRDFGHANGGGAFRRGKPENYLAVCDMATGAGSEGAHEMAEGIRSVIRGSAAKFELEYPCDSAAGECWFISRVTRFECEGQVRIVVTHDDISLRRKLEAELSESSATIHKRAAELVVANVELAYQSDEKGKRAAKLVVANVELVKNKKISDDVWKLAFYDGLTNLPNRRLLNDRLAQAMAASRRSLCNVALMMLDLDNFKLLNDTHGHAVGDLLLVEVGRRLSACVREVDTVARFGGDEFVVMLSELHVEEAAAMEQVSGVAEKIRASLAAPYQLLVARVGQVDQWVAHRCSVSIGIVVCVSDQANQADIMIWADSAMYQAKRAGRNAIRFHGA